MIAHVNGICAEVAQDKVTVDVSGVGFEVNVSTAALAQMPGIGEPVMLFTYLSVREDDLSLYGFLTRDELSFFRMLIGVSGIGPKGALAILSSLGVDDLRFAILSGDAKTIARAQGVGKKTAERLVLELRDKLSKEDIPLTGAEGTLTGAGTEAEAVHGAAEEAAAALAALGYGAADAMRAVRSAIRRDEANANDTETLLSAALKELI